MAELDEFQGKGGKMFVPKTAWLFTGLCLLALIAAACSSAQAEVPTLTVAAVWSGGEREAFMTVLDAFTAKTGIRVGYESMSSDMGATLRTRVAAGNPPDLALEPRPGEVAEFARTGNLVDLGQFISEQELATAFSRTFIDLGKVDGKQVGILLKANSKSTFWYRPDSFRELGIQPPKTLDELFDIAEKYKAAGKVPFAVGGKNGWVLTDYQENIFARLVDVRTYNDLYAKHGVAWTDPQVKRSLALFAKFFQSAYEPGGAQGVLKTSFTDSIGQVFGPKPQAEMIYEGGFVGLLATSDVNKNLRPGQDIDFFTFPQVDPKQGDPIVGGGDIAIAFRDSPQLRELMDFLISKEAANILAKANTISPNKQLDSNNFASLLARKEYEQLVSARTFVFDGSDMAPSPLGSDLDFIELGKLVQNPSAVDQIAQELEDCAKSMY